MEVFDTRLRSGLLKNTDMLFTGWEVRIVKNCDRGLENAARGRIFKPEVTVFHDTDRPKAGK